MHGLTFCNSSKMHPCAFCLLGKTKVSHFSVYLSFQEIRLYASVFAAERAIGYAWTYKGT